MTRRRKLIYPYATGRHSYVDPTGQENTFVGDDPEVYRDLYLAVAQSTLATHKEIWEAAHMIAFGPSARTPYGWSTNTPEELKQPIAESRRDSASLDRPNLPLSELIDIWERSLTHLRLLAKHCHKREDREAILEQVADSERRMAERVGRYRARVEGYGDLEEKTGPQQTTQPNH
jgi:hypothetical protein